MSTYTTNIIVPPQATKIGTRRVAVKITDEIYLPQGQQDPATHLGRTTVCAGSGRVPLLERPGER